jgi:hypothetical protein
MAALVQWELMTFNTRQLMFTKAKQQLQDCGASEWVYNSRAIWVNRNLFHPLKTWGNVNQVQYALIWFTGDRRETCDLYNMYNLTMFVYIFTLNNEGYHLISDGVSSARLTCFSRWPILKMCNYYSQLHISLDPQEVSTTQVRQI